MAITKNTTKINIKTGKILLVVFGFLWVFQSCVSTQTASTQRHKNLAYLYNADQAFLHPEFQIYNLNGDSSLVFVKLPYSDLLSQTLPDMGKFAVVDLQFRVYESLAKGGIIDSASYTQKIKFEAQKTYQIMSFKVKSPQLHRSYLSIEIKDSYSERSRKDYIEIDKTTLYNRQNFLLKQSKTREPIFGTVIQIGETYEVQSSLLLKKVFYVQETSNIQEIAEVPYIGNRGGMLKLSMDTTYQFTDWDLKPNVPKAYLITADTTKVKGIWLMAFDSTENWLHTPSQLIEPLAYLLLPNEVKALKSSENSKDALDRIWLKIAGNQRLAKEMITTYYHRVETANRYFTSYKQGWMTDRGMIYTVFGEPSTIYKSDRLERWIYGNASAEGSITFDFNRIFHPLSDNAFQLAADDSYKEVWSRAIDAWRSGRIFSIAK
ncbi:MAG: GWxTD domain-containing protein [Bacteroidales bacterium]|nr:GWxTD domain-containing protein [Bacteroidales bacterium]